MATITDTYGYYRGTAAAGNADYRTSYIFVKLDFAKIVAARSAASVTALAAADTIQALLIPAGWVMLQGGIQVTSAETTNTTATFDVGFLGASPAAANVFADDLASNALAGSATGLAAPIYFAAADTLDVLINTAAPANAVVTIWAYGFNSLVTA